MKYMKIEIKLEDLVFRKTLLIRRFDIRRYHFQFVASSLQKKKTI